MTLWHLREHDACGVGLIASLDGKPSRRVVELGIEALGNLWHRGAVDADGKTGDGAGIHVEIPQSFFQDHIQRIGREPQEGLLAVGMVFLPRKDMAEQEFCRTVVEAEIFRDTNLRVYGWRQVPINVNVIGEKAASVRPEIEQILILKPHAEDEDAFERQLYHLRRRIENRIHAEAIRDFYMCSLSCRSVIYKGMFLAEQLTSFYPDLNDARFISRFAIYHQRYSTNTFPTWKLAQPFRMLAHNGEINTIQGNSFWMQSHEARMASPLFGEALQDMRPVIQAGASDSAALDNVMELLCRSGRNVMAAKALLIPEAWDTRDATMSEGLRALYSFSNSVIEPWDGPAAVVATDGDWVMAGMDRSGLRPLRYAVNNQGILVAGSEAGMVRLEPNSVIEKGRLGPGHMLAINLATGEFLRDAAVKEYLSQQQPYTQWVKSIDNLDVGVPAAQDIDALTVRQQQKAVGWTLEDVELILHPMAATGKEAVGSMGDDTPLAVLSSQYRPLHHFFRQNFSQVTNPPIDPIREARVMSLRTRLGNLSNILTETPEACHMVQLESPILLNHEMAALYKKLKKRIVVLDCTYDPATHSLREALDALRTQAEHAVTKQQAYLWLSDKQRSATRVGLPMILAIGAVHSHLMRCHKRTYTSLNVEAADVLDAHSIAVMIGVGATTVNPYLAEASTRARHAQGLLDGLTLADALANLKHALEQGLLKIMSKLGISVVASYRGGYNFEALGLSRWVVSEYFPGMSSKISGIGLHGLEEKIKAIHQEAFADASAPLPIGGFYRQRARGEQHAYEAQTIHLLQEAVGRDSYTLYKKYSALLRTSPPVNLRDLLDFQYAASPAPMDDVESVTEIRKAFVTPAMSLGALSPEAHGALNIAMNRIGAKSDSGEGGEDKRRYKPAPNGDNANSAIKQVASGRFGVTAEYLNQCREIEIKIAQGAKPGEGGQLPAFKVTPEIAELRHATAGVMLISPPPHHDIYSIEDLAQLIYDLKQINPRARVGVKLVARTGIGTIAAGVAKAKADVILISGHNGGTGASPQTSLKFAGVPWELGLSEVHQVLSLNNLRQQITLRTDGGIKTGRDVVIAAILGAEEYGIGTASLVAMGCLLVRQCHSNTCPVGICSQDPALRAKFEGTPEKVINLFSFIAEEVREILSQLGVRSLADIVGRTEFLRQVQSGHPSVDDLDLNSLLAKAETPNFKPRAMAKAGARNEVPETLDAQILLDAKPALEDGEKMQLSYTIRNTHRAVGTKLSGEITRRFGMAALADDHLTIRLRGSAGQSLGAFAVKGVTLEVHGDANDYVGKGLSGGIIILRPRTASPLVAQDNALLGNTALYGATAGKLFAAGQAGERFAVRNSGAITVIEGCGANGCEYMTGGMAVILGAVGHNFAAGMTGGMAFVYDPTQIFPCYVNPESVVWQPVEHGHYATLLRDLLAQHATRTLSTQAKSLLIEWEQALPHFWHVVPKDMLDKLAVPLTLTTERYAQ